MSTIKSVGICLLTNIVRQWSPMFNMYLENCDLRLTPKCVTSLICGYCTDMDVTGELKDDGVQWYK